MLKRYFCCLCLVSFLAVPLLGQLSCIDVYADTSVPGASMSEQDMVDAFIAYCKSRNVVLSGSTLDALTKFTTKTYNSLCNAVGINPTQLQAELSKVYDSNNVFQWYAFTAVGINGFNRLFSEFLQNNALQVGDTDVNKTVYSGMTFTDADGRTCLVYIYDRLTNGTGNSTESYLIARGTPYYSEQSFLNDWASFGGNQNISFNLTSTQNVYGHLVQSGKYIQFKFDQPSKSAFDVFTLDDYTDYQYGSDLAIFYITYNQKLYLGYYGYHDRLSNSTHNVYMHNNFIQIVEGDAEPSNVIVTTPPDKTILPTLPDDEPVNITPDGTTNTDPEPQPPGGTVPDWTLPGTQITPIDPENPSGGSNIDWNFELPDLNIDWNINLGNKFPFCIPGDIYQATTVLSTEPVAPHFAGTIDLLIYQWEFDIDLSMFDSIAVICRNAFFILFVIGLIALSRAIIMKG